jgi:hypothetical protein
MLKPAKVKTLSVALRFGRLLTLSTNTILVVKAYQGQTPSSFRKLANCGHQKLYNIDTRADYSGIVRQCQMRCLITLKSK